MVHCLYGACLQTLSTVVCDPIARFFGQILQDLDINPHEAPAHQLVAPFEALNVCQMNLVSCQGDSGDSNNVDEVELPTPLKISHSRYPRKVSYDIVNKLMI